MAKFPSKFKSLLTRQSTLKVLDRLVKNEYALVAGLLLFALAYWLGWWDWIEPFLTLVVLPVAGATWFESWRARNRRYSTAEVGRCVIVAVEVNADTAASVQDHFHAPADLTIRSKEELGGKTMLSPEDCTALAKIVAQRCYPYRNVTIKLVLAGPAGLCFQVGQLLAAHKFDIVPLSWARDHYQELSRLGTEDIGNLN